MLASIWKNKSRLVTALILIYSNYQAEFILAIDASYHGYGATLSQIADNKKEHPVAYTSKSLKREKINYAATKLECATVVWAIEHFYKYLNTSYFTLITDHLARKWLKTSELKGRIDQ